MEKGADVENERCSIFMKSDKLRKHIFESAWLIVESEGMEQLTVRKLAHKSGYSLGSIYNAFGSFHELQLHINASTLTQLYQILQEKTEQGIKEKKSRSSIDIWLLALGKVRRKHSRISLPRSLHSPTAPLYRQPLSKIPRR